MESGKDATTVVHLHRRGDHVTQDCDVYIGRANFLGGWQLPQSKWANPFKPKDIASKSERLKKYKEHILSKPDLIADFYELKGKRYYTIILNFQVGQRYHIDDC